VFPATTSRIPAPEGFIAHVGRRSIEAGRALADMKTWLPLLGGQMRRLGVDSVPIALFIAVFTGIVLSLLSSYIFTGTVPL
jgi:ABC-type transporter Mla maintaining outer membrane lipid asymmetry permease subunit MlaE